MRNANRLYKSILVNFAILCFVSVAPCRASDADAAIDTIVGREQSDLVSPDFQLRLRALTTITAPMRQHGRIVAGRSTARATAAITELFRCELAPCPQVRGSGYSSDAGVGVDAGPGSLSENLCVRHNRRRGARYAKQDQ